MAAATRESGQDQVIVKVKGQSFVIFWLQLLGVTPDLSRVGGILISIDKPA